MVFKKCFIKKCKNNSNNRSKKIFIHVPNNLEVRKKWFTAVQKPLTKTGNLYCCEDHFNVGFVYNMNMYKILLSVFV